MQDYRKLNVWHNAHQLVLKIYKLTETFPSAEKFGLISQIRRAAVSIPANIAEGCSRQSQAELAKYLFISLGSSSEVEYYVLLSRDLGFLKNENADQLQKNATEVKKMLSALIERVRGHKDGGR